MREHVSEGTEAFRNVLMETECDGQGARSRRRVHLESRTPSLSLMIKMYSGVTQNDFCTNHPFSFPTLLTALLTSEGQWPGLVHPGVSADPFHVVGAWLTFISE